MQPVKAYDEGGFVHPPALVDQPPPYEEANKAGQSVPFVEIDRAYFIRTVYRIVGVQSAIAIVCIFLMNIDHYWALDVAIMQWPLYLSFALFYVVYFALLFLPNFRRQKSWRYVLLVVFTFFLCVWVMIESTITVSAATPYVTLVIWSLLCAGRVQENKREQAKRVET